MSKKTLMCASLLAAIVFLVGCNKTPESANANANDNANAGPAVAATTTRPGPDNSEITSTTDANGVKTETRVFRNNPHVSKVVVTTRNGTSTARAYSPSGEEKEVKTSDNVLETTGEAVAHSAGFVADKTVEGTKKVADKTAEGAKKGVEVGKDVGEKTAEGAKKVGEKTAEGAKKTGKAIKRVVSP